MVTVRGYRDYCEECLEYCGVVGEEREKCMNWCYWVCLEEVEKKARPRP